MRDAQEPEPQYMPSTGELIDIERVTISSEGGRWKSTREGNSLAAYPTSRTGLTGGLGRRAVRLRALILPTYLTPTAGSGVAFEEPSLGEWARVIKAGACIEASFQRGKGEVGMDEYQVRTWHGWHHHMALSLMAVWFLIGETHRGQQVTPALTLPQVRYGLSRLLLEVCCTPGVDDICRQVQRQLLRNELARFYHHRTRKCIPPRKLRREIQ